jgi:hypothetical protein
MFAVNSESKYTVAAAEARFAGSNNIRSRNEPELIEYHMSFCFIPIVKKI